MKEKVVPMLKFFEVDNFRGFDTPVSLDFKCGSYAFNEGIVSHGLVKNAIIYGKNGIGKSALGIAIFDIVSHLTDKNRIKDTYLKPYCNCNTKRDEATFKYVFDFDGTEVVYSYAKDNARDLRWERVSVGGKTIVDYNYSAGGTKFVKAEVVGSLNIDLPDNKLSIVKYIVRNTPTGTVPYLSRMTDFCDGMLWYRSLSDGNDYAGFLTGSETLDEGIFSHSQGDLAEFEQLLRENGVEYSLSFAESSGQHRIMVSFANGTTVPFDAVASTGTQTLRLFYYWKSVAFTRTTLLFIDEFDAFLHFEAAASLTRTLNAMPRTQVVLTSHNTYLMRNDLTRPDCCYIMTKNRVSSLANATDRVLREGHNLGKLYVNGAFTEG